MPLFWRKSNILFPVIFDIYQFFTISLWLSLYWNIPKWSHSCYYGNAHHFLQVKEFCTNFLLSFHFSNCNFLMAQKWLCARGWYFWRRCSTNQTDPWKFAPAKFDFSEKWSLTSQKALLPHSSIPVFEYFWLLISKAHVAALWSSLNMRLHKENGLNN